MKYKVLKHLTGAVLAILLSVATVGIICSGFNLGETLMPMPLLYCVALAAITAVLSAIPYGGALTVVLGILSIALYLDAEQLWMQIQTLVCRITLHFHDCYGWQVLGQIMTEDLTDLFALWVAVVCAAVNFYYSRRKGLPAVLMLSFFPLVLCLISRLTVPNSIYLFFLMMGVGLLLITDWTGRHKNEQEVRLTWQMTVPVAVFLALILILNPMEHYENHAQELADPVIEWFDDMMDDLFPKTTSNTNGGKKLNLLNYGPKSNRTIIVLEVSSPFNGTLYLRGMDYDIYSGTIWRSSPDRYESFSGTGADRGVLTVTTHNVRDLLFVPYYSAEPISLKDGAARNDEELKEYHFALTDDPAVSTDPPDEQYTQLPQQTFAWATGLVNDIIGLFDSDADKVRAIQNYVLDSALYDRNTPYMDSTNEDFARWFLEESDKGYCVHFATAATVLLRAAGIPARYVEGYMVQGVANQSVTVTNQDAHAWVEYFDRSLNAWRILEVTPADLGAAGEETTEPTAGPENPTTEPSTEPDNFETMPVVTQPDETEPVTMPQNPGNPGNPGNKDPQNDPFDLQWAAPVLWIIAAILCVIIQSDLRIYLKRKRWNQGGPNDRTISRWHQTRRYAKVLNHPFPEELDALAQKAKFSQHQINPEELSQFDTYRDDLWKMLYSRPWYQIVIIRLVFALAK